MPESDEKQELGIDSESRVDAGIALEIQKYASKAKYVSKPKISLASRNSALEKS